MFSFVFLAMESLGGADVVFEFVLLQFLYCLKRFSIDSGK